MTRLHLPEATRLEKLLVNALPDQLVPWKETVKRRAVLTGSKQPV